MKRLHTIVWLCFLTGNIYSQEKIYLYDANEKVTKVGVDKEPPFILYFKARPDSANRSAVLICPGGGYTMLADQHEGNDVATLFNR